MLFLNIKTSITIAVLLPFLGRASNSATNVLNLDDAVAIALEHNRNLKNSSLDRQKAEDKLAAAQTRQFPSINLYLLGAQQLQRFDFTLEKGVLGTYSGVGPIPNEDVHLSTPLQPTGLLIGRVSQPVSALIRIRRSLDTLKTGVKIANEQTRAERQKVVRDVKRIYYELQQTGSALQTIHETEGLYRELEKLTENYVAGEIVLKADLLEVRTRLAKAEQSASLLVDQLAIGKQQLNILLGRDGEEDFEVQPVLEATNVILDLEAARQHALQQRPEIQQAKLRVVQAQQDVRAKKAEYIPDVAVEFNSLAFLNWGRFMPAQSTSIGVSLTWEPFDWGRKKHEIAEKQRTVTQASEAEKDASNTVLLDVNRAYRQLRYSRGQLQVARLSHETALESLRVVKKKYSLQAVLFKDVLQGQVNLEQSNSDYQQALLSFWNARADYERALGEDQ
jgi:outer membrane protein TolC